MTTKRVPEPPERARPDHLAGVFQHVATADLYEIVAAALTEMDRRGEGLLLLSDGLSGVNGQLTFPSHEDDVWEPRFYPVDLDDDGAELIPGALIVSGARYRSEAAVRMYRRAR